MNPLVRLCAIAALLLAAAAPLPAAEEPVASYPGFPIGEVVPKPKSIHYSSERVALWDGAPKACVVVPQSTHPALTLAAREIAARPGTIASLLWPALAGALPSLPIVADLAAAKPFPTAIVLAAPDASLLKRLGKEGYLVTWSRRGGRRVVECCAATQRGAYYGAQSLQQLMDAEGKRIVLRVAEIEDRPVFGIRSSGNDGSIPRAKGICDRAVEWLPHFKLNGWAVGQSYIWPDDWRETPKARLDALKAACRKARAVDVIDVIFQIHPFRGRPHDKHFNMVISDPTDIETFIGLCDEMLTAGARGINFRADDYHPLSPQDQERFGSKAAAHIFLIRQMHKRLKAKHPDYYLIFCPPYYTNVVARRSPENIAYLRKLGPALPPDVHIMWTGAVTRSLTITHDDIKVFRDFIGRDPFLWDNTVYAHRSRYGYNSRHPGYCFDTFATEYPADYGVTCPGIRYNWGFNDGVLNKVGNINIADYMWNPAGYQPEPSLRQAIGILGGKGAVDDVLAIREGYYEIKDARDAGKVGEMEVFTKMEKAARELPAALDRVRAKSRNPRLATDLGRYRSKAVSIFRQAQSAMGQLLAARKTILAELDFSQTRWKVGVKGKWTATKARQSAVFSFPLDTRSFAGAYGQVSASVAVPPSPTGRHYLVFSVYDDYTNTGTPRNAWPGYFRKQVLVGDALVWEDDVEGQEPSEQQAFQIVDVTDLLRGKQAVRLTFRGFDKRGVGNMHTTIRFANACLVAGPFQPATLAAEIPDCAPVRPSDAFTIALSFTPRKLGSRIPLYAKQKPMQLFAYIHEGGNVAAGVFVDGSERNLATRHKVTPGRRTTFAFVVDHGVMRLYLDGALEAQSRIGGAIDKGNGQLTLGAYSSGSAYFGGAIHEARFFARALSKDELAGALGTPGQARDIAANASCEALDAAGKPTAWSCRPTAPAAEWGASNQAHSGQRSLIVRLAPKGAGATLVHGPTDAKARTTGYAASPKTVYHFSLWVKGHSGRLVIDAQGRTADAPDAATHSLGEFPVWLGADWKRFEGTFMTRADTKRLQLLVHVPQADGEATQALYIDDIALRQLPPGLVGWWKLDDPTALVAHDLAGACPDGALYRRWRVARH